MESFIRKAFALFGPKGGQVIEEAAEIAALLRAPDLAWLHMQADAPGTRDWLQANLSYLDPIILTALLASETRPRCTTLEDGVMLILRGINTNPGADPEDMVSIRLWLDPARIVSLSQRDLAVVEDVASAILAGHGPATTPDFLVLLVERLNARIEAFLRLLDERTDEIEAQLIEGPDPDLRRAITDTRRRVVAFRRHIGPQRDALAHLASTSLPMIDRGTQRRLQEATDRLVRVIEEADMIRDRLGVVRDELTNALSERLNRNLYLLSLVSALFLPLGFLTGLFGINLAGMPGAEWPPAFWVFSAVMLLIAAVLLALLRWLRWF